MKKVLGSLAAASLVALALAGCSSNDDASGSSSPSASTDAATSPAPTGSASPVTWSYSGDTGPDSWGDAASTCASTDKSTQSPIDIEQSTLIHATTPTQLEFHYGPTAFEVENNGHTIEAVPEDLTSDYVTINGKDFYLQQFHLHNPSEHQINGANAAMELHLVNKAADGTIAVVGVLFNAGADNATLDELFSKMPAAVTTEDTMVKLSNEINPADLLPVSSEVAQYIGSLTTPPCTEGVLWNVYETISTVSADQLAAFNAIYPDNHRPVQALNGREVDETP